MEPDTGRQLEQLEDEATERGITVGRKHLSGLEGVWLPRPRRILIEEDLDAAAQVEVLRHELQHSEEDDGERAAGSVDG